MVNLRRARPGLEREARLRQDTLHELQWLQEEVWCRSFCSAIQGQQSKTLKRTRPMIPWPSLNWASLLLSQGYTSDFSLAQMKRFYKNHQHTMDLYLYVKLALRRQHVSWKNFRNILRDQMSWVDQYTDIICCSWSCVLAIFWNCKRIIAHVSVALRTFGRRWSYYAVFCLCIFNSWNISLYILFWSFVNIYQEPMLIGIQ